MLVSAFSEMRPEIHQVLTVNRRSKKSDNNLDNYPPECYSNSIIKTESGGTVLLITRETDYALRVLRVLSCGEQVTTKEICEKELLPQQFVYKIIKRLSRAGLVSIARGSSGGCRLVTDLKKISLYDLTQIMDADNYVSECVQPCYKCDAQQKRGVPCVTNKQLRQIQDSIDGELKKRSLYQMLFDE